MQPEIRFFRDAAGRDIAFASVGSGPLLVCPAWWVSHLEHDWEEPEFRGFFGTLAQEFRVVRYDRVGVGLSDRSSVAQDLDEEVDTLARLLDHLAADRASLLAISCGGPVALRLARQQPTRIERLCFMNAYARGTDLASAAVRDAMIALVDSHWGLGSKALADVFAPNASGDVLARLSANQRAWASAPRATQLIRLAYAMDASDDAPEVRAPTLVLHRAGDRAIPLEAGRKLAAAIPGAQLRVFDHATHLPWLDGAREVEAIVRFLGGGNAEPAAPPSLGCLLDEPNRALVRDGQRVALTPLEWGVLRLLTAGPNRVVTRDTMLREVWRQPFAGSNKVDAVLRTLRRKLGNYADSVETVTGHGYRFTAWRRSDDSPPSGAL